MIIDRDVELHQEALAAAGASKMTAYGEFRLCGRADPGLVRVPTGVAPFERRRAESRIRL